MSKPVVRYLKAIVPPVVGGRAVVVLAEDHHTLSPEAVALYDGVVTTSTVQWVGDNALSYGRFETLNTLYVLGGHSDIPTERSAQKSPD